MTKPNPSYKDSGVEWLGEIPSHWDIKKLKYVTRQINDGTHVTPTYVDEGVPFLRVTDIQGDEIDLNSVMRIPESEHKELYKRCNPEKGDLLLSKNGTVGITKVVDWDYPFSIFVSICLIKFTEEINPYFFSYFFQSDVVNEQIFSSSKTTSVTNLHLDKIRELITIVPSIEEQQTIADFLDRKTAQINTLIEKKQQQIELLQEQRTSLINYAVTKGQRKDNIYLGRSLAPWLFPLPAGWKRQPLKYNSYMKGRIGYQNLRSEEYTEEGPYLVSSTHFNDGSIEWDKCNHVTRERFEMAPEIILQKEDVLFMKDGALMGKLAYVNDLPGEACLNSHLLVMRPLNGSYLPRFLYYVLMTDVFESYMIQERTGTTFFGFSQESMGNFPISLPPMNEQTEICKYLDEQTQMTKTAIERINDGIFALQEYRTALISEAVTGKIDVRTAV